jgi:hypothetical protein
MTFETDFFRVSGFRVGKRGIRVRGEEGLGDCTAKALRAQSKEFLIKKYSDLCELCASAVNIPSQ